MFQHSERFDFLFDLLFIYFNIYFNVKREIKEAGLSCNVSEFYFCKFRKPLEIITYVLVVPFLSIKL